MSSVEDRDVSLLAVDQYMRQVWWTVRLTGEEVAQLMQCVERGRQELSKPCPDEQVLEDARQARDRLVEGFQWLVIRIAKQYQSHFRSMELLDLIQEGNLGLLQAIERKDMRVGYSLCAFATRCIRDAVLNALCNGDRMVRVPKWVYGALRRMREVERRLVSVLGREPSFTELAYEMGETEDYLRELVELERRASGVGSLQQLSVEEGAEDRQNFVSLYAASAAAETGRQASLKAAVHEALASVLPKRQREVMQLRFGLDGQTDQQRSGYEVAAELGVLPKSVYRSEQRAKVHLQQVLAPTVAVLEGGKIA